MFSDVLLDCVQIADFDFFLMKTYNLGRVRSGRSEVRDVAQRFFSGLDILDLDYVILSLLLKGFRVTKDWLPKD